MGEEPVVPYIFPQEPKTVEELEESRKLYITLFNISNREKLEGYLYFFEDKIAETEEHIKLIERPPAGLRRAAWLLKKGFLMEKETKTKMLIFWKGLRDEVKRRL